MAFDYDKSLEIATKNLLAEHPRYQEYLDAITTHLGERVKAHGIEQTGGMVMVPTWFFRDYEALYLCVTFEGDWLVGLYNQGHQVRFYRTEDNLPALLKAIDEILERV